MIRLIAKQTAMRAGRHFELEVPTEVLLPRLIGCPDTGAAKPRHDPLGQIVAEAARIDEVWLHVRCIERRAAKRRFRPHIRFSSSCDSEIVIRRSLSRVQPTTCGRSRTVMIVASIVAIKVSVPAESIEASAWHTVIVRPGRTTRPRATNSSPEAGASRFVLNSTVSTPTPAGIRLNAA